MSNRFWMVFDRDTQKATRCPSGDLDEVKAIVSDTVKNSGHTVFILEAVCIVEPGVSVSDLSRPEDGARMHLTNKILGRS